MDGLWWRVLTKHGPVDKGMANHFSILPWSEVKSLSCVQLSVTPWTAAYQAPPSMGFSRQEYWSGVPLSSPDVKLLVLNYMAYLCFLLSLVYKVLFSHIWKWSFVNTWKHLRTLKLSSWHQHCAMNLPCFALSHGIDDGDGVRHELSLRTEFLPLLEFNTCNHQIKIWTWGIANMAWIVTMIFPHKA